MEGPEFRKLVVDESKTETSGIDMVAFDKIWPELSVLARSSPQDKRVLVT